MSRELQYPPRESEEKQEWKKEFLAQIPDKDVGHTSFCCCVRCKMIDQIIEIVENL